MTAAYVPDHSVGGILILGMLVLLVLLAELAAQARDERTAARCRADHPSACTGYRVTLPDGRPAVAHDGDICPIHEA